MSVDPRSHGLWAHSASPAPTTNILDGDASTDVLVVGAGFTGTSAALHLAEAGAKVAVLEAESIGFGGSGRNVGLVNAGMWMMPDAVQEGLGPIYGPRLLALLGEAPGKVFELVEKHGIACDLTRTGNLHCAVGNAGLRELEERARQWLARGAPVRLLDAGETTRRVGTTAYAGSLLDERTGTLQPLSYVRGLASAAIRAGAKIFTQSPAIHARDDGRSWTVRTHRGRIHANWIVVATEAYTHSVWPEIRAELVHLPYFNVATKPLGGTLSRAILPDQHGVGDTKMVLSSFRVDRHKRLIFGGVGSVSGGGGATQVAWARRAIRRIFPQLKDVEFEHQWGGNIGMTVDNLPRFHAPGRNVLSISGYNGRGIAAGTVFGGLLARRVLGQIADSELPLPLTETRAVPFRSLRETFYELGSRMVQFAIDRY
jgi:glycine/D-amino acid oxidase-like deaminating enzyme